MNYYIVLSSDAEENIDTAVVWYEATDPKLARRFLSETDATLERIRQYPYRFPLVKNDIRRALLRRFRYAIYYSLHSAEVYVIAVVHQRRSETIWMNRCNSQN